MKIGKLKIIYEPQGSRKLVRHTIMKVFSIYMALSMLHSYCQITSIKGVLLTELLLNNPRVAIPNYSSLRNIFKVYYQLFAG